MIKRLIEFLIVWGLVLFPPTALAATPDFWRDVRITHELSRFDFTRIDRGKDANWAVLEVVPAPYAPGEAEELGKLPRDPTRPLELIPAVARRVAVLRGSAEPDSWPCYFPVPARITFGMTPIYAMDRSAGMCICRVNERSAVMGNTVLDDYCLIPDGWEVSVKPALECLRGNRDVFAAASEPASIKRLTLLAQDKNPLVSIAACKAMTSAGSLLPSRVPKDALDAVDQRGVLIDFLLLHDRPANAQAASVDAISQGIDAARTMAGLHGIATACALDLALPSGLLKPTERASYRLLQRIESRATTLSADGKPDEYLKNALQEKRLVQHMMEIRERKHKPQTLPAS